MKILILKLPIIIIALISIVIFPITVVAQEDVSPNPTRPSAADNAYITQLGYSELEFGLLSQDNFWNVPALLKFAFHKNIELGFLMSGLLNHSESENELGDPGLQIKAKLMDKSWGAFAVAGRVDRVKNLKPKYTFYAVGSFPFNKISIDGTVGTSYFDHGNGNYSNSFQYAVSCNSNFGSPIGGFLEVFGEDTDYAAPFYIDGGLSYQLSSKAVLDCSVTFGLNDDAEDWIIQVGFTKVLTKILK